MMYAVTPKTYESLRHLFQVQLIPNLGATEGHGAPPLPSSTSAEPKSSDLRMQIGEIEARIINVLYQSDAPRHHSLRQQPVLSCRGRLPVADEEPELVVKIAGASQGMDAIRPLG